VASDPHAKLRRAGAAPSGRGAKGKDKERTGDADATRINEAIEHAQVVPGMTRDEVLMSIGYPPAHRTPSLESPRWVYWHSHWQPAYAVNFEGDRVVNVQ